MKEPWEKVQESLLMHNSKYYINSMTGSQVGHTECGMTGVSETYITHSVPGTTCIKCLKTVRGKYKGSVAHEEAEEKLRELGYD
jgi:hypothetical protein